MPIVAIVIGGMLLAVGIVSYVMTGSQHLTALIPALFGMAIETCGTLVLARPAWRMHAMHAAVTIALLGAIAAAVRGVPGLLKLASGESVDKPIAVYAQAAMMVLCAVFVVLCVRSFIAARRARENAEMR